MLFVNFQFSLGTHFEHFLEENMDNMILNYLVMYVNYCDYHWLASQETPQLSESRHPSCQGDDERHHKDTAVTTLYLVDTVLHEAQAPIQQNMFW